jgi:hypothetical protein
MAASSAVTKTLPVASPFGSASSFGRVLVSRPAESKGIAALPIPTLTALAPTPFPSHSSPISEDGDAAMLDEFPSYEHAVPPFLHQKGLKYTRAERKRYTRSTYSKKLNRYVQQNVQLPPEFQCVLTVRHKYYFLVEVSGVANVSINDRYIRGAIGGICTVANSKVMPWAGSIKLHSIVLWPSAVSGSSGACDLYWVSTGTEFIKDDEKFRVLPEGITETGPLKFTPPAKSLAGEWISDSGSATNLAGLSAPNGTVVCLDVSFTLANNITAVLATVASGTLGSVYYLALDGPTSNLVVPLGVPTTH